MATTCPPKWPRLDRYKEHNIELPVGMVKVGVETEPLRANTYAGRADHGKGRAEGAALAVPGAALTTLSTLRACPDCGTQLPEPDPRLFSYNAKHGWCPIATAPGSRFPARSRTRTTWIWASRSTNPTKPAPACHGARLNPVARAVRFRDLGLHELASLAVGKVAGFFDTLRNRTPRGRDRPRPDRRDPRPAGLLQQVGLGYLALDRAAPTLSRRRAQRIRLAAQVRLQPHRRVLHPRRADHRPAPADNRLLLDTLENSRPRQHPAGGGARRGHHPPRRPRDRPRPRRRRAWRRIVAEAAADWPRRNPPPGAAFANPLVHPPARRAGASPTTTRRWSSKALRCKPQERLSPRAAGPADGGHRRVRLGQIHLCRDVLHASLVAQGPVGCASVDGMAQIGRVLEVDQTPSARRRAPARPPIGFWDAIRKLFAETTEAKMRGWNASRFSFNTGAGRCPVRRPGPHHHRDELPARREAALRGLRWRPLQPRDAHRAMEGQERRRVLNMAVEDAVEFFAATRPSPTRSRLLQDVGLGLTLGQPSPTLSGGEAQRIKLVSVSPRCVAGRANPPPARAARCRPKSTRSTCSTSPPWPAYTDVEKLIHVLHRLADASHTVLVIEHDLDLMAEADWIIDLGPEGGEGGGEIVAEDRRRRWWKSRGRTPGVSSGVSGLRRAG